jgi:uncharacterized integral membrane protein
MAETQRRRGGGLLFVVGLLIGIPATIFALSNLESTTVEFLGWAAEVPLWAVIMLSILIGALLGTVWLLTLQARRKRGRRKAAKRGAKREKQAAEAQDREAVDRSPTKAIGAGRDDVGAISRSSEGRLPS